MHKNLEEMGDLGRILQRTKAAGSCLASFLIALCMAWIPFLTPESTLQTINESNLTASPGRIEAQRWELTQ